MKQNKSFFKRILSLVTAIMILASVFTFGTVFAYTPSMNDDSVSSLLKSLNIIDFSIDQPDSTSTRENFAVYVANMLNIGESTTSKRYFADVENTAYSSKAINTLAEMGIISAAADKYFNPGAKITMSEALKMLVCAVGAKGYAEAKGGYPYGYEAVARELKIYSGSDSQTLTTSTAANLVYKTMTVPIVDYNSISTDSVSYKKSEDNILSMYWNIKYSEGVVTSVYGATISGAEVKNNDELAIDGTLYKSVIDLGDTTELIGEYINYFYYDKKDNADKEIMFIAKNDGGKEKLCISIDDFEGYNDSEITYSDSNKDGRSKTQSLGAHKLIYNGVELGSNVDKTMKSLNKGFIYVIDANTDNVYDTVVVFDFLNFYVSAKTNDVLYNKLNSNEYADLTKTDFLSIRDTDGNVLTKEEIESGMLLSAAMSKDGKNVWLYKSNVEFSGAVEQINENDKKIKVDGKDYDIEPSYKDTLLASIHPGDTSYFILDKFGKIAYSSVESSDDMKLGYIIAYTIDGAFNDVLKIKMLTADNVIKTMTAGDSVTVDGERFRNDGVAKTKNVLDNVKGERLIRYKDSEDGSISKIDTTTLNAAHESTESSLCAEFYETTTGKWYNSYYLARRAYLSTATKVFYIPTESTDDADYRCANPAFMLSNDATYYADAYYTSALNGTSQAAVVKYSLDNVTSNISSQKVYFVYKDTEERLNEAGETVRYITGFRGMTETSYEVDDAVSLDGIDKGDMVTFSFDSRGRVINKSGISYTMIYDASKSIEEQRDDAGKHWVPLSDSIQEKTGHKYLLYKYIGSGNHYRIENQLSYGKAVKKFADETIKISAKSDLEVTEIVSVKNLKIVVVEKNSRGEIEIRTGGMADIITAETTPENCSKIFFWTNVGAGRGVFVYNI